MEKSSFALNHVTGYWEKDGVPYPLVVEVRPDKCLCSKLIRRRLFKAHTLVAYDPKSLWIDKNDSGSDLCFIKVVPAEGDKPVPVQVQLCMLNFNKEQQQQLYRSKHVPKRAFVKNAVALHFEMPVEADI